ncbi:MAG: FG-GAP-like repeat-containing protein [Pyrinomonadaceae bacterium]
MKISFRALFLVGFGLLFAGFLTTALLPYVNAGKDSRKLRTTALPGAAATAGTTTVAINELDADQVGADAGEFVELKTQPGASLNGYVLVFYNGSNDLSYAAFDLDGLTADANGFVVLGNTAVPGVDVIFAGDGLQNGQDAVALYVGDATSFPNNTPVTTTNIVDAVVYDTSDADDPGLLALLNAGPAQVQIDENGAGTGTTNSVRRCSAALRDGRAFSIGLPTPNAANSNCPNGKVDLNGDGRTDYVIARPLGVGLTGASQDRRASPFGGTMRERLRNLGKSAGQNSLQAGGNVIQWWGLNSSDLGVTGVELGDPSQFDAPLTADFDGDGKDDMTVWRPVTEGAYFFSINSSDFTLRQTGFGQEFDNPYAVGDYDGDGVDDPAVYRCPQDAPGTCYFYYRPSSIPNPGDWAVAWGFGQGFDFLPFPGDFNGDGKRDFAVQAESPNNPNNGIFYITLNGSFQFSAIEWGLFTDRLVSGDFDGDGKSDITVTRVDANDVLWWYVLEQDGGTRFVPWGDGLDFETPGDYDGDGRDDFAIYRWNATDSTFWVQPANGSSHFAVTWGQPGDYPVSYFFVGQ